MVKYRLYRVQQQLKEEEARKLQRLSYRCEYCNVEFTELEVQRLINPRTHLFSCAECGDTLREVDNAPTVDNTQDRQARLRSQLNDLPGLHASIVDLLTQLEGQQLPHNKPSVLLREMEERNEKLRERGELPDGTTVAPGGGLSRKIDMSSLLYDKNELGQTVVVEIDGAGGAGALAAAAGNDPSAAPSGPSRAMAGRLRETVGDADIAHMAPSSKKQKTDTNAKELPAWLARSSVTGANTAAASSHSSAGGNGKNAAQKAAEEEEANREAYVRELYRQQYFAELARQKALSQPQQQQRQPQQQQQPPPLQPPALQQSQAVPLPGSGAPVGIPPAIPPSVGTSSGSQHTLPPPVLAAPPAAAVTTTAAAAAPPVEEEGEGEALAGNDVMVSVAGRQMRLDDVTEDEENDMTPEEYQVYSDLCEQYYGAAAE